MNATHPGMTATDLASRASNYARLMAKELEDFNKKYPYPEEMLKKNREEDRRKYNANFVSPSPEQLIPTFERFFCFTMASHKSIIRE